MGRDLNDLAVSGGAEAIQRAIANGKRATKAEPVQDGVILVNGSDLKPEPISWLWREWLARGKLHILGGPPGQGKTTIALGLAATVTCGGCWPDGSRCEHGNVLIWSGEDDPADTLLPRLLASGGERNRIYFVTGARVNGEVHSFDPARDMLALQEAVERIGNIRLIIVDPIVSAVTGDSHKNTETRRALQPLVDLAASTRAALIGITHFSKGGQGADPAQRLNGSIAFSGVPRVVMVAAKVKSDEDNDRRIFARAKSNIGPEGGGYEYHLQQSEPLPGISASSIAWGEPVAGTARELLTDPNEQAGEDESALSQAVEFLRAVLRDDVVPAKAVEAEAKHAGIAMRTVRRASERLQVKKRPGVGGKWYWSLPKKAKPDTVPSTHNSVVNMDNMNNFGQVGQDGQQDVGQVVHVSNVSDVDKSLSNTSQTGEQQ
ncbi:AAA family ATPase [Burkholderia ambifaria]|uniref:AAA family ATPase n=1 Tax=Burkholderia ambifaria TaxID=152480 RepID=UPI001FC7DA3A|nr:AAA family ATPase [Burkholderia ambifaria]